MALNTNWGALISVLGAVVSWVSFVMSYLLNRASALEAARPELVLTDWSFEPVSIEDQKLSAYTASTDAARTFTIDNVATWFGERSQIERGIIRIKNVKNVGKGSAFHVIFNPELGDEDRPAFMTSTQHIPLVASGETIQIDAEVTIWWKNVRADKEGHGLAVVKLYLITWDTRGMRYKFNYNILCSRNPMFGLKGTGYARGLYVSRRVERRAVWALKLEAKLGKWWQDSNKDLIDWPSKES